MAQHKIGKRTILYIYNFIYIINEMKYQRYPKGEGLLVMFVSYALKLHVDHDCWSYILTMTIGVSYWSSFLKFLVEISFMFLN